MPPVGVDLPLPSCLEQHLRTFSWVNLDVCDEFLAARHGEGGLDHEAVATRGDHAGLRDGNALSTAAWSVTDEHRPSEGAPGASRRHTEEVCRCALGACLELCEFQQSIEATPTPAGRPFIAVGEVALESLDPRGCLRRDAALGLWDAQWGKRIGGARRWLPAGSTRDGLRQSLRLDQARRVPRAPDGEVRNGTRLEAAGHGNRQCGKRDEVVCTGSDPLHPLPVGRVIGTCGDHGRTTGAGWKASELLDTCGRPDHDEACFRRPARLYLRHGPQAGDGGIRRGRAQPCDHRRRFTGGGGHGRPGSGAGGLVGSPTVRDHTPWGVSGPWPPGPGRLAGDRI